MSTSFQTSLSLKLMSREAFNRFEIGSRVSLWEGKCEDHKQKQLINPFSEWEGASHRAKLSKEDREYGKPIAGSKTEHRGKRANWKIGTEITTLLQILHSCGYESQREGYVKEISFGELFLIYSRISNKMMGIMLRARKHGLVDFQGEMLFQGRDESNMIHLTPEGEKLRLAFEVAGGHEVFSKRWSG